MPGDLGEGRYVFDVDAFELRRDGQPVDVEPQVLEVLRHLVEHPNQLVRKEELLDEVWGDRFVSESALTSRIRSARRAVGDDGKSQRVIQTVHGRGYRFVGGVEIVRGASAEAVPHVRGPARHNLPVPRTRFVGRVDEVRTGADLVRDNRLVSFLGMGGSGKTRLAAEVGRAVLDDFPDGVWFVDLVPRRETDALEVAVADAAGVALEAGSTRGALHSVLGSRRVLLILDNCEHVIGPVTGLVDDLLDSTSGHVLLTSRLPLNLAGEYRVPVRPLPVEGDDAAAIALFVGTAERFGVDPESLDPALVAQVCRRLDGLPLALELAAAQLRHLAVADLAARLDERFDLLVASTRDPRHPSLLAMLADTWDGLDPGARELLFQLAVFPGEFRLRDVEELVDGADTLRRLGDLVDNSLVVPRPGGDPSYRLLDTVRTFGLAQGDDAARRAARDRHAEWCLESVGSDVRTHLYDYWLAHWCQEHHDDLLVAASHLADTGRTVEAATLDIGSSFALHLDLGARAADALRRIDSQLAHVEDDSLAARLHFAGTYAGMACRAPDQIAAHGTQGLHAARKVGDPRLVAPALVLASWSAVFEDGGGALEMVTEAADLAQRSGDEPTRAFAESYRAWNLAVLRRFDEALATAEEALGWVGDTVSYPAASVRNAVAALLVLDDPDRAAEVLLDHPAHPTDSDMWSQDVLAASIVASQGDVEGARARIMATRDRLERAGIDGFPDLLVPCAVLALRVGDEQRARAWTSAVRRWPRRTQSYQVTTVYRIMREHLGPSESDGAASSGMEAADTDAFDWLTGFGRGR